MDIKIPNKNEQIDFALKVDLMGVYPSEKFPAGKENDGKVMLRANALLYLVYCARTSDRAEECGVRAVEHLKNLVDPKQNAAPHFDLSCNWPYGPLTAAITLAHETPSIWDALTEWERSAYDLVMEAFLYVQALGTNDPNNYRTGPGLVGNFGKGWNPNYRLANIPPVFFAARYFGGADKVDEMLLSFDYDKTVARFKEYGFLRAYNRWTTPVAVIDGVPTRNQKDFMENGGEAFINTTDARLHYEPGCTGGTGEGVRVKYTYHDNRADDYAAIINDLLAHNYSGGEVISSYGEYADGSPKAYIADGTKSPVEGKLGMMKELKGGDGGNGRDGGDIRSCTGYCSHDFLLVCAMLLAAKELSMYELSAPENAEIYELAKVGNLDLL